MLSSLQHSPALAEQPQLSPPPVTPLAITRLSLHNFRNYRDYRIEAGGQPIIITGNNGIGKTNLLESLSLLVPGKGLRKAAFDDLQNNAFPDPWGVAADVLTPDGIITIGTGRDPANPSSDRRALHINGRNYRQQSILSEIMAMAWVTPDMDRLLADGASARRAFLDRLAYSFDPAHNGRIARYEKAMRDRLHILRHQRHDPVWLNALENDMAQTGVAIAAARNQLTHELQLALNTSISSFPRAEIRLSGTAEEGLLEKPALLVEDHLRQLLADNRMADRDSGMTNHGPHRSDLLVTHGHKQCPARLCSTGEQKALLIAIILAYVRLLSATRGMTPLLLLDDIAAHLDETRRQALFDEIGTINAQAWISGTDANDYAFLSGKAQFVSLA